MRRVEDKSLPLQKHLKELKRRILISILFFIIIVCITFGYSEDLYRFIAKPLSQQTMLLQDANTEQSEKMTMIYTAMGEGFTSYLRLSLYAAIFLSIPFWLCQFYRFIAPGLLEKEKKIVLPCVLLSPILFYAGATFLYYVALPLLWKFFLGFQYLSSEELNIILHAKISEYLSLLLSLAFAFGLSFQLPVIVIILTGMGIINSKQLKKKRRYAIVFIFVVAAFATPPDVISQVCLAIPLLLLYELSIFFSKFLGKADNNSGTEEAKKKCLNKNR